MSQLLARIALAFQLLTRLPIPGSVYTPAAMAGSAAFFPLVGLFVGIVSVAVYHALQAHAPASISALAMLLAVTLLTGALHEDGLADAADAFGAGGPRDRILAILKDSRIGSYGALALIFSIGARWALLAALPAGRLAAYVITAHVLCRWSMVPLAVWLPSAREGQGAQLAGRTPVHALLTATLLAIAIPAYLLRTHAIAPIAVTVAITLASGLFYRARLGGITGDCFGATNQLSEIAVLLCGVLH